MLYLVLKAQEDYLVRKAFQRLPWWSNKRLCSVISIIPKLTEAEPLWHRGPENLASVHLWGLTPQQLQKKLHSYWKKPWWKQWLLRLWTPISQQIQVWAYYQQCLAFQKIKQQKFVTEPFLFDATPEHTLLKKLAHWLIKEEINFQRSIENRSISWLKKYFYSELDRYKNQRKKRFLTQLRKGLAKLPPACNGIIVLRQSIESYEEVKEAMYSFMRLWYQRTYYLEAHEAQAQSLEARSIAVVAYPSTSARHCPSQKKYAKLDFTTSKEWFKKKQRSVKELLKQEETPQRDKEIQELLEKTFVALAAFIEPQLGFYQTLVTRVILLLEMEPQVAMEKIKRLQHDLITLYRQGALLFHPDHFPDGNASLTRYSHEIFVRYKKLLDNAMIRLDGSQKELEPFLAERQAYDAFYERMISELNKLRLERQIFMKEINERIKKIDMQVAENKAEINLIKQLIKQRHVVADVSNQSITEPEAHASSFPFKP